MTCLFYTLNRTRKDLGEEIVPFQCPDCSNPRSLRITSRLELPPDSRSDEISLQIIQCRNCGFAGLAIYEESRRGSLDSEIVNHIGYHVHAQDLEILKAMIKRCPEPGRKPARSSRCGAAAEWRRDRPSANRLGQKGAGRTRSRRPARCRRR